MLVYYNIHSTLLPELIQFYEIFIIFLHVKQKAASTKSSKDYGEEMKKKKKTFFFINIVILTS